MGKEASPGRNGFIPPYQDLKTLAEHLCLGESTIELWVKLGKLPPPVVREGKRLWRWKEVDQHLAREVAAGAPSNDEVGRIREATRAAITPKSHQGRNLR